MSSNGEHCPKLTREEADDLIRRHTVEVSDHSVPTNPKLSVLVIAYNHAAFIGEALDGALAQRADFPYEIIVGEDCSTDGTKEIVLDYQKRHPDKIRVLLASENFGKHTGNGRLNLIRTFAACRGDYIAMLEGDDSWTDPEKLQLQVNHLDRHNDCALVHHKVDYIRWPGGEKLREFPAPRYRTPRLDEKDLAMFNCIQTCSVVLRRKWMPIFDEGLQYLKLADWPIFVLLSQRGWIGYLDRNMARYRIHPTNIWNNRPAEFKLPALAKMAEYLLERVDKTSKDVWRDTILAIAFKDFALAAISLSPAATLRKLVAFYKQCVRFRKPFWVFNRLGTYYRAYK